VACCGLVADRSALSSTTGLEGAAFAFGADVWPRRSLANCILPSGLARSDSREDFALRCERADSGLRERERECDGDLDPDGERERLAGLLLWDLEPPPALGDRERSLPLPADRGESAAGLGCAGAEVVVGGAANFAGAAAETAADAFAGGRAGELNASELTSETDSSG